MAKKKFLKFNTIIDILLVYIRAPTWTGPRTGFFFWICGPEPQRFLEIQGFQHLDP